MLPQPFLRPFPTAETVFVDPVARYERHLSPLVSIDLSAVDPGLSGWVHLVSPIEPEDGCLGDHGKEGWGRYLQPNWIAFRLTHDHRYELLGDFRFFGIENIGGTLLYPGAQEGLTDWYEKQHASFAATRAAFKETGQVIGFIGSRGQRPVAALEQLGGEAPVGNMIWQQMPDSAFTYDDDDTAPRTHDGRLYRFIASVPGWHYRASGADNILLYYDPVERTVLETFDYT